MEDNEKSPLEQGAKAAGAVNGAIKTGKAIAGASKGAAVGGPYGAAVGFIIGNPKIFITIIAVLMIPILIVCMLPPLVFTNSENNANTPDFKATVFNNSTVFTANLDYISNSISNILNEALAEVVIEIDKDFDASGADNKEIINPYSSSMNFNSNLFISQYCALKNSSFESISVSDLENLLQKNKSYLYSYSRKIEERIKQSEEPVSNATANNETENQSETKEITAIYTIKYNGEEYFADNVFHLTQEQKTLANNYAENLSLFLGDSVFQKIPEGYETIVPLGDVRFTDGQTDVVYFNQLDKNYADKPYGTDNIGGYGCGPTAMAIVVSSLTDKVVNPVTMAEWAYENGYWCKGSGSYHSLIPGAAKAWGLSVEGCSVSESQKIVNALSSGKLVVAIMSKGHFTKSGHFIVLRGVKDGKILVADPVSHSRSEQQWDLSIILNEASSRAAAGGPFWIIG